ncbi:F-box/LRR-repeat protein 15 [Toxorhynchites rutilus septentrionalis]|uniref:F-box/LRR-repeat protein 15 n=1 Tax=Toxorhynchites rutilus septentrionalis TaxID=329112 RepID=UPI00247A7449|nr:F-box/LRR-repeat protein 15 [Toxorhynchites rutilus septentrionalis]
MAGINNIHDHITNLTLFDIAWEDVLYVRLFPLFPLKDLFNLRCCSRLSKVFVDSGFRKLKEINLSGINNPGVQRSFHVLSRNCGNARLVNLAKCDWLNDSLLCEFIEFNTKIEKLNLSGCFNITAASIESVIIECKELQVLKLAHCSRLTSGALEAPTTHDSKIRELDLSYCCALSERCITILLVNCNYLSTLSVAYVPCVTDNLLYTIAKNLKSIKHLNIIGCQQTSDRGVGALSLYCNGLQSLMVRDCSNITERSLSLLRGRVFIDRPRIFPQQPMIAPRLCLQV